MICPKCSSQNDINNVYCNQCGHRLKAAKRGFASMDQAKIARSGGIRAHKLGRAHTWTIEEARVAGKKGGKGRPQQTAKSKS